MVKWEYPHGPVVPVELFTEVQLVLEKNAKFNCKLRGTVYYLSQILYHADGVKFSGAGSHGRNEEYHYYHCPKKGLRIRKEKLGLISVDGGMLGVKVYIKGIQSNSKTF